LTHLEQWKWDIWEAESRAKQDELEEAKAISFPVDVVDAPELAQALAADAAGKRETAVVHSSDVDTAGHSFPANATRQEVEDFMDSLEDTAGIPSTPNITITADVQIEHQSPAATSDHTPLATAASTPAIPESSTIKRSMSTTDGSTSAKSVENTMHEISRQAITDSSYDIVSPASPTVYTSSVSQLSNASWDLHLPLSYDNTTSTAINSSRVSSGHPSQATTTIPLLQPSVAPSATGGESIYRTIMNRLTALEANHTLYARYVEEQTAGVRDMLRRLGEEVGRLEGIVSSCMIFCSCKPTLANSFWSTGEGTSPDVPAYRHRMGAAEKPA
jgi:hypothetical protein